MTVSETKSRTIKISSIEPHKTLAKISAKPYFLLAFLLGVALYLIFTSEDKTIGIFIFIGTAAMLIFVKDKKIIEAADRYILVYNSHNSEECTRIFLSEISSWQYIYNRKVEELIINLDDGSTMEIPLIMTKTMMRYLRDKMSSKEIKKG